jgi:hypothetical protein
MKTIKILFFSLAMMLFANVFLNGQVNHDAQVEKLGAENIAYVWGKMALDATANDTEKFNPRPTITSRFLGLIFTSVFDAWSRYDATALPVYLEGIDRRPKAEMTLANKEKAISYAAHKTMCEYFFTDKPMFDKLMKKLGYDPNNNSLDPSTPEGIGNLAALALFNARKNDGSNQYGTHEGSKGKAYFDYTGYEPVNTIDENIDINKWQPKYFEDQYGKPFVPKCLTPYWQHVKPITMESSDQYRPGPPPVVGSEQLALEVKEVVDVHANLTDKDKALVEFMRDGPKSVQQAGHWLMFAQEVSVRDNHTLDQDVKMYFLNQITAMDAFIAAWDSKMHYDYARPFALVHEYYAGKEIYGWIGPEEGWGKMDGSEWRPYSPAAFLCPPFPSYVSGHSCISGACGEALKLYKGSDEFGAKVKLHAGYLTEPNNLGEWVELDFPTFTEAAEMAGQSRVLGGYHIQADNVAGLELGRNVARHAYKFYLMHLGKDTGSYFEE